MPSWWVAEFNPFLRPLWLVVELNLFLDILLKRTIHKYIGFQPMTVYLEYALCWMQNFFRTMKKILSDSENAQTI